MATDLRIVIVGKTGVGKSATGNTILGQKAFKEELSTESVTEKWQEHQQMVEGRIVSVIDTPGRFGTKISEEQLKDELVKCVEMSIPGPHAFLLVIRLDDRFTEEHKNTVKWIQENFGKDAARYTIVLFTRGDQLDKPIDEFLTENKQINELVSQCDGGYHVFNNTDEVNRSQVTELLEKIDRMVKENRGEHYTNEMYKEAQRKIEEEEKRKREQEERQRLEEEERIREAAGDSVLTSATNAASLPTVLMERVATAEDSVLTSATAGVMLSEAFRAGAVLAVLVARRTILPAALISGAEAARDAIMSATSGMTLHESLSVEAEDVRDAVLAATSGMTLP